MSPVTDSSVAGAGEVDVPVGRSRAVRVLVRLVDWYQAARAGRPSPCRYLPSCSAYAREALEVHGAGRGSWLAVRRVSRCHPLGGHGWDPVPEKRGNTCST